MLVAAQGQLGKPVDQAAVQRLYEALPELSKSRLSELMPFKESACLEHLFEGLASGGLPLGG